MSPAGYLYQLLAAVIKGNHTNCSQFANSHRLNWLFSRLGSAGEGTGMLDVLHCVLVDSPEALNVMKVSPCRELLHISYYHLPGDMFQWWDRKAMMEGLIKNLWKLN